jgi:hypothetical protein
MVLFALFILVNIRLSNERWINSKFERFYCMCSKRDVEQRKLLAISTKHLARGPSKNVQLNIGSKNFVKDITTVRSVFAMYILYPSPVLTCYRKLFRIISTENQKYVIPHMHSLQA